MNYIYVDKIRNFVGLNTEEILNHFKNIFEKNYGENIDVKQQNAWKSSIDYLKDALKDNSISEFTIAFEYKLPFSNERIDLLIFGKDEIGKPTTLIFELKGWNFAEKTKSQFIVKSDIGDTIHPEYQVENYVGKIKFSHSAADNFNLIPAILMYNASSDKINIEFERVKCFYKNDVKEIRKFITSHLKSPLEEKIIHSFLKGEYKQSKKLFDAIKNHFDEIKNQSYLALARNGWGLSEEQLKLIEEIINDLKSGQDNIVYLIQGNPGSGKTLVAIHLLLSALSKNYQTILAYRNNRLINSIRDIFDSIKRGV